MKRYRLVATGEHAKQLTMCDGGPDLLLWPERPILMGRAVHEGEGYKYPKEWISLSSKHCTLQWKVDDGGEGGHWEVTDTSTNGTFINGAKVGKDLTATLMPGQTLGLSTVTPRGPQAPTDFVSTVEYILVEEAGASSPNAPMNPVMASQTAPAATTAQKRKPEGSLSPVAAQGGHMRTGGVAGNKRLRSEEAEVPELSLLRKTNQELRAKLDASREEVERLDAQLQGAAAEHSRQLQEQEEKLLVDKAAAERSAAEALQAERSRAQQLQQQLAEQAATAAEHQRCLQAQLSDLGQQLAGTSEEVERLGGQLRQAQEGMASRDAELARLQGQLSQEQHAVSELQVQLAQHQAAAAALSEAQQALQAKTDALTEVQGQLREEQRGRAAAEAAVRQAEKALGRAKTSLHEKLESERENLLVYGRSVHETHAFLVERLQAQQEELQRHQQETVALNTELRGLLDRAASEHSRHTTAVSGLVQGVEEGLAQIVMAGQEAGLATAAAAAEGCGMDMDEEACGQDQQQQQQGAPSTQPLAGGSANAGAKANAAASGTPDQSHAGQEVQAGLGAQGLGHADSTPAATQEAGCTTAGTAAGAAAAAAAAAIQAPAQAPALHANNTEVPDFTGQTQDVFAATLAFPATLAMGTAVFPAASPAAAAAALNSAAAAALPKQNPKGQMPTPGFEGRSAPAPAPTPTTAAGGAGPLAFNMLAAAGSDACAAGVELRSGAGVWGEGAQGEAAGGLEPSAMQQQFQAQLEAAFVQVNSKQGGQQQQEGEGEEPDQEMGAGEGLDASQDKDDTKDEDMVQGSQDSAQQQQQQQEEEGGALEEDQEVAETPQETQQGGEQHLTHSQQQQQQQQQEQDVDLEAAAGGDGEGHAAAVNAAGSQDAAPAAAAAARAGAGAGAHVAAEGVLEGQAAGHDSQMGGEEEEGVEGEGSDGSEDLEAEAEELGVTDEDHTSSQQQQQGGSVISGSEPQHVHEDELDLEPHPVGNGGHHHQQQQQQQDSDEQQQDEEEEQQEGSEGQQGVLGGPGYGPSHTRPSTFPQQQQQLQVKSLLGSSGSPGLRPHSQPMSNIDLNKQQLHVSPLVPGHPPRPDPFEYRD